MTQDERAEWSGNPLLIEGANLIPKGVNHSPGTAIQYRGSSTKVTAIWEGAYVYAIVRLGPAADYEGKTFTLSLDSYYSSGGGNPNIVLYWHDANGAEYAGGGLTDAGSMTFTVTENTAGRENLAVYLYATTDATISAGAYIVYEKVMLELGDSRHDYVPYYAVVPTMATKGAYNYSDLNRVEQAVSEIADRVGIALEIKTDWTFWDIPRKADMDRFLGNISKLRDMFPIASDMPSTPTTMSHMTYITANNIETIVLAMTEAAESALHSGDLYAGEV